MSKNIKVNDKTYNGVSTVELTLASGIGTALFKDVDEIVSSGALPEGIAEITCGELCFESNPPTLHGGYNIPHGQSAKPHAFVIIDTDGDTINPATGFTFDGAHAFEYGNCKGGVTYIRNGNNTNLNEGAAIDETNLVVKASYAVITFNTGHLYKWAAVRFTV